MRENEKSLWKSGVYILLHDDRKKQYNMAKVGNLKTKRERGVCRGAHASYARTRRANPICCSYAQKCRVGERSFR
jgi:hypothetical protein